MASLSYKALDIMGAECHRLMDRHDALLDALKRANRKPTGEDFEALSKYVAECFDNINTKIRKL